MVGNERLQPLGKVWPCYKWMIVQPAGQEGRLKLLGSGLYAGVLVLSIALVTVMFGGAPSTFIDYQNAVADSDEAPLHRLPDVIGCPAEFKNDKRKFFVQFHRLLVKAAKISNAHLDELAQIYYDACNEAGCSPPPGECGGTKFEQYCNRIKNAYFKDLTTSKEYYKKLGQTKSLRFSHWLSLAEENKAKNGSWTLAMLWAAVRFDNSGPVNFRNLTSEHVDTSVFLQGVKSRGYPAMKCSHNKAGSGGMQPDESMNKLSWINVRDVWVDKTLCHVSLGVELPETKGSFFGCSFYVPAAKSKTHPSQPYIRLWFGSLESTPVEEKAFISPSAGNHPRMRSKYRFPPAVGGVVHYKLIKMIDETVGVQKCMGQPLLRGLKLPCVQVGNTVVNWYVDLVPQARNILGGMWIYSKTLTVITKKPTFTSYTRFQFGIGLFGCCLGFSFMQLISLLAATVTKLRVQWKYACQVCESVISVALTTLAIGLTIYDVHYYVQNRYTTVFTERDANLKFPVMKICTPLNHHGWSFINTTALYEHNVSLQLYGYLKFAGWLRIPEVHTPHRVFTINGTKHVEYLEWARRNFLPKVETIEKCTGGCNLEQGRRPMHHHIHQKFSPQLLPDADASRKFFEPLHQELSRLGERLGLGPHPSVRDFTVKLGLDPGKIFKSCWIGKRKIPNCGQYAGYIAKTDFSICIVLSIPQSVLDGPSMAAGYENGLTIIVDRAAYGRDSDFSSYYGPNTDERLVHPEDTHCGGPKARLRSNPRFKMGRCGRREHWSLFLQHPVWGTAEIEVRIYHSGIFRLPYIQAELSMSFAEDGTSGGGECYEDFSDTVCSRPKEDATNVLRALAMMQKCGCAACFSHLPRNFFENLAWVRGKNDSHCCSGREYYDCYFKLMEQVDWEEQAKIPIKVRRKKKRLNDTSEGWRLREFLDFNDDILVMANAKKLSQADANLVRTLFPNLNVEERFSQDLLKRMAKFVRDCFKPICKLESVELTSLETTRFVEGDESTINIFYGSKRSLGTERQDLLSPFQMIATLLNSLSFTLGVSLVGLAELILLLLRKLKHGAQNESIGKVLKDHLMQGIAVLEPGTNRAERANAVELQPQPQKAVHNESNRKMSDIERSKVRSVVLAPQRPSATAWSEYPAEEGRVKSDQEEHRQIVPSQEAGNANLVDSGWALVYSALLLLFTSVTVGMMLTFYSTFSNSELTSDMAFKPFYRRPSVILCVKTKAEFIDLRRGVWSSNCTASGKSVPCETVFLAYMRNKEDRFCLIQENSRTFHKLDGKVFDLIVRVPKDSPPVFVLAEGFNKTSINDIYPVKVWEPKRDMNFQYTVRLKSSDTGHCTAELPSKPCKACEASPEQRKAPHICCLGNSPAVEPAFMEPNACHSYEYSPGVTSVATEIGLSWRELAIKAATGNMLVFTETRQYHWIEVLSALGGFCGSFLELTLLSLVCSGIFAVAQTLKRNE